VVERDHRLGIIFGFTDIANHEIPELLRLAHTLNTWRDEFLAYFDTGGVSNGPTEASTA
jgi:transposase